ncbi:MAG: hypothetical protein ABIL58_23465 [Pseudomonadota bacterium]
MTENTIIDAKHQVLRCEVCGDEVPIPLGDVELVCESLMAFAKAHAGEHGPGRTRVSEPVDASH